MVENSISNNQASVMEMMRESNFSEAINVIETRYNYLYMDRLRSGTYGDLIKIYHRRSKHLKAAKIISKANTSQHEMLIWPLLDHKNIIPVNKTIFMDTGTVAIIMPYMFMAMDELLSDVRFDFFEENFAYLKKWLRDIIQGIEYLHSINVCHLDLKLDNVLLSTDGTAVICDFSFVNTSVCRLFASQFGLPKIYRPPELFDGSRETYNGVSFDLWSCGTLMIEALTKQLLLQNLNDFKWASELVIFMKSLLKESVLGTLIKDTFPTYVFDQREIFEAINLVSAFLVIDPAARIPAYYALKHSFFRGISGLVVNLEYLYKEISKYIALRHLLTSSKRVEWDELNQLDVPK